MSHKLIATQITNNFWIVKDGTEKCGVMSLRESAGVSVYRYSTTVGTTSIEYAVADIENHFIFATRTQTESWNQQIVFGYPVPDQETFQTQEQNGLPCFTKTVGSTVFFAAGYYSINFDNGGWMESFCPKLSTLLKYEHMGPFKTESDMQLSIQRKKRDDA